MSVGPARADDAETVVLVEGVSDRTALETLARRHGRVLADEGIAVVAMGGAHAVGVHLARFGPLGADRRLAGLCDAGEQRVFRRRLGEAGLGPLADRGDLEGLGFFVCDVDLEDELIRALGSRSVLDVIEEQGDLGSFRTLQKQPQWRDRPVEAQLRRFMGSIARRKQRYARALVEAVDLADVPRPLDALLTHLRTGSAPVPPARSPACHDRRP
jgi:hypothetical protein